MDWLPLVKEVGFPIAVAGFVLIRLNGKMDRVSTAMLTLNSTLEKLLIHELSTNPKRPTVKRASAVRRRK